MLRAEHKLVAPILVLIIATLGGCYTLLKHPAVSDGPEESDFGSCTECHSSQFHPAPYDPVYADPWWDYYELPWWYQNVVEFPDSGIGRTDYRGIIERETVHRDEGRVGINPPGSVGAPVTPENVHRDAGESTGEPDTRIKKQVGDDSRGDKRSIENRNATKRGNENKTADTKSKRSADEKDTSKDSDQMNNSSEKKKEKS